MKSGFSGTKTAQRCFFWIFTLNYRHFQSLKALLNLLSQPKHTIVFPMATTTSKHKNERKWFVATCSTGCFITLGCQQWKRFHRLPLHSEPLCVHCSPGRKMILVFECLLCRKAVGREKRAIWASQLSHKSWISDWKTPPSPLALYSISVVRASRERM